MRNPTWTENRLQTTRGNAADGVMRLFLRGVAEGVRRARQRQDLAGLSDYSLRDIGLSRADVDLEVRKPFWRD